MRNTYVHLKTNNKYILLGEVIDCDEDIKKYLYVKKNLKGLVMYFILKQISPMLFTRSIMEFKWRFQNEKVSLRRRL